MFASTVVPVARCVPAKYPFAAPIARKAFVIVVLVSDGGTLDIMEFISAVASSMKFMAFAAQRVSLIMYLGCAGAY